MLVKENWTPPSRGDFFAPRDFYALSPAAYSLAACSYAGSPTGAAVPASGAAYRWGDEFRQLATAASPWSAARQRERDGHRLSVPRDAWAAVLAGAAVSKSGRTPIEGFTPASALDQCLLTWHSFIWWRPLPGSIDTSSRRCACRTTFRGGAAGGPASALSPVSMRRSLVLGARDDGRAHAVRRRSARGRVDNSAGRGPRHRNGGRSRVSW